MGSIPWQRCPLLLIMVKVGKWARGYVGMQASTPPAQEGCVMMMRLGCVVDCVADCVQYWVVHRVHVCCEVYNFPQLTQDHVRRWLLDTQGGQYNLQCMWVGSAPRSVRTKAASGGKKETPYPSRNTAVADQMKLPLESRGSSIVAWARRAWVHNYCVVHTCVQR